MQKCFKIQMIFLILFIWAGFTLTGCDQITRRLDPEKETKPESEEVRAVSVVTVATQKVTLTTELPGRTAPFRMAEIRPQVNGLILKRQFTEGANVTAGQVLYQIDPAPFQAALDNAEAALARAKANLAATRLRAERYETLLADNAVSRQSYDDAAAALTQVEADIAAWKATVKSARINLAYTRITAPISGRIGRSNVTEGAIVTAYQPLPLATIQQLDPIFVDVPQSTIELLRMKDSRDHAGEKDLNQVKILMEDGTAYPQDGTLQFSDVTVDPTTGSVIIRAVVPNPENRLLPGMFVRAQIMEGVDEHAILIPQQGVSRDAKGNPFALVVDENNRAAFRGLVLDRAIGDQWLVSSGITPGEKLIVEGLLMLRPGMAVAATPFDALSSQETPDASSQKKRDKGAL
ncbi:efflux RND transporter periplasmic adaptor subunit [Desulfotignum phosphitoxidans]|uniref:Multidrug resistance protein A n=1 Tax=Desulfotignum phosphitoxidans DSM 13687 TaxID=1286635 RepID=S0G4C7_9BACT|nr:efflux RND transporter periplasmic adaptor subunit [Desulfotignum phosphitoxidans]EMS78726.1 multidrug resistance protein A [Desulfotignum phosphitoxidans DSM 13687]